MMRDQQLREHYPWISWDEPIHVEGPGGIQRYACRLCVAHKGLKGAEVAGLYKTAEEAAAHIAREHPHE